MIPTYITDAPGTTLPQYQISTNGTAQTPDSSEISPLCAVSYVNTLADNIKQMTAQLNSHLGQDLCSESSDLLVSSSSTQMSFKDDVVYFCY